MRLNGGAEQSVHDRGAQAFFRNLFGNDEVEMAAIKLAQIPEQIGGGGTEISEGTSFTAVSERGAYYIRSAALFNAAAGNPGLGRE